MPTPTITPLELLEHACRRYADRVALRCREREVRFDELRCNALGLASGLRQHGVEPGARVLFLLRNSIEYAVADLAVLALGAIKVPLNEYLSAADVAHTLDHAGPEVAIVHSSLARVMQDALAATGAPTRVIAVDDDGPRPREWHDFAALARQPECTPAVVSPDSLALLLYTGGTTGRPKGVVHTRAALGLNLLSHIVAGEVRPGERMLLSTPLPHSAGFHMQACLAQGGTVTLLPRFDADAVLTAIARERIGWTFLVPTMLYRLLESPALGATDLASLQTVVYGAAPIDPERMRQALERFGPVFLQLYGQVEAPNFLTTLSKRDHLRPELRTSCGQPVAMAEVRVAGDHGNELAHGEVGELEARAPYTLKEYYRAPELTAAAYRDGWLRTGDLAYQLQSGHVFLVDRAKDMIISGGMNVYSREVESVLLEHPGISAAAVFGVPHADWGEAVHAVLVPRGEERADAIVAFCRSRLAAYKVPKTVTFAAELPLTPYGKVDKKALRAPFWAGQQRAIH